MVIGQHSYLIRESFSRQFFSQEVVERFEKNMRHRVTGTMELFGRERAGRPGEFLIEMVTMI